MSNGPAFTDLNEVVRQVDIKSFLESIGITVQKKSKRGGWYCRCPFCGEDEKLSINDSDKKGLWKCFKCEESGNLTTLYAKTQNCDNKKAIKEIKKFAGVEDDYKPTRNNRKVPPKVKENDIPINSSGSNQTGGDDIPPWDDPQEAESAQPGNPDPKHVDSDGSGLSEETAMGVAQPRDVYAELVRIAVLTDAHRQELRTKRGFTDALIDRLAFRSGGQYMVDVIEKLRTKFSDLDLKDAGVLVEQNGSLAYNDQLLDDRILIPYLNENSEVYHLRPHKLGFKGRAPEIYCRFFLKDKPAEVVLTEGEFKAAALYQLGIPAIAIPGISSFGARYFDLLVELLKEFDVKKISVIFDNEIKDNPEFPNYKERPEDRHDTDFWAYMMAYKLSREEGLTARVGKLPDNWRQKGKIDFDGALAMGKTREDLLKVISQSQLPKEFLESLPEDASRIVRRKIAKQFTHVPIKREFNKYVAIRQKGTDSWEETISNFVINIKSSFFTPEGVIRNVQLVNEYGEVSATFPLTPSDMAGLNEMKKFCFSKGNYVFEGSTSDLLNIWKYEFLRDIGDLIYMPDRIGYIHEGDLWLFGNLAVKHGKIYRPDPDGIMWVDGKGYKPQSIQLNSRGESSDDAIPSLSEKPIDLKDFAQKFKQTVGGYEAYMGLGWVIATVFSKDIFAKYKCMPILFPHGKRESGKSTFMRWIMACFGTEVEGVGIAETTQNYIARALAYYSSLGCWFDEYRNEARVIQKDGFFRSAYNRQLSGKGTATAFQTKGFSVHAAVAISGEELPKDNGLFTRLIPLQISEYKRDRTWYEWINRHMSSYSYLTYYLILHYDELKPKILENIADLKKALLTKDISDRTAENWAICAGAFDAVILQDDAFIEWVEEACQDIKRTGEKEHMLNQFLSDIAVLVSERELNSSYLDVDKGKLALWLSGTYNIWAKSYRQKTGREPFDELSIRKYLSDEPYYLGTERYQFYDGRKRAILIDLSRAPESLQEAVEIMQTRKWKEVG